MALAMMTRKINLRLEVCAVHLTSGAEIRARGKAMPSSIPSSFRDAARAFGKIGLLSFGGPAAQIALMHKILVDENNWLTERQFLNALNFCMLLPGPEAMQLATYAGWRLHGVLGGLTAGLLFVIPGAIVILGLAMVYAYFGNLPLIEGLFLGIKAAVLIIVVDALLKVAKRALTAWHDWFVAAVAFVGIFFLSLPYPLIGLAAAGYGFLIAGPPQLTGAVAPPGVSIRQTLMTILIWLLIWGAPIVLLVQFAEAQVLIDIGVFFSKLAVVTFGGAYAVLAYMAQQVVNGFGWLQAGQMMDGLGLAETTPGPLILVTEFVGFLAGFGVGGLGLGLAAAGVTLWVTFVPCFLWIFAGAPYIDWMSHQPRLSGALTAITAAVVGVILNLSLWFALHVIFASIETVHLGPLSVMQPDYASADWRVLMLAIGCAVLLLKYRWGVPTVLMLAAVSGLALSTLT